MKDIKQLRTAPKATERIVQFGEGNFLRAFVDWMVDVMNKKIGFDASVVLVQPIAFGRVAALNEQDCMYTLTLKGITNGVASSEDILIESVSRGIDPFADFDAYMALATQPEIRFVVSNTTEAGIAHVASATKEQTPADGFPAKLTQFLFKRFEHFAGAADKGLIMFPCELIEKNAEKLRTIVLQYATEWALGEAFAAWVSSACSWHNTLVDRIVPGVPQDRPALEARVGYVDHSAVEAEPFHLWVIEADEAVQAEFPAPAAGLNLVYAKDLTPYRTRKVRILNGVHTMMTPIVYLGGVDTVGESFDHPVFSAFIKKVIVQEIIPTLDLSLEELNSFAASVEERFRNPYVSHAVLSISLNSVSKYKARVLPSVVRYATEKGALPQGLTYALAALIVFYKGNACDRTYNLSDDAAILTKFETLWHQKTLTLLSAEQLVAEFLSDTEIWDVLPADVEGLVSQTALYVDEILENGILASLPEIQ